ncbi:hypothetical protein [Nocardia suismassiliense]|uniref:hypothetical protein n=1 Tax=Nocardia suismassiliense TaxID=2077092 RepID=UPI000D1E93D7|nr:hypothetical protein [Nocardia suismassiliense]
MNITEGTAPLVYDAISKLLAEREDSTGLVDVSCIARGADSVFARAVLDAGGNLKVVLLTELQVDHAPITTDLSMPRRRWQRLLQYLMLVDRYDRYR